MIEIMKLIPTGKDYLWGGTRLRDEYGKKIDMTPLAESWECSVHPDGPSFVVNGKYKGKTLKEVLDTTIRFFRYANQQGWLKINMKYPFCIPKF